MARLSMNEMTTYRWTFEDDVQHYAAAGYEAIAVWRDKLADFGEEKGAELLAEAGLSVSALSWAGGFTGSDGRSHSEAIDDAHEAIELAEQLHAGCLMVHSGARAGHTQNHARRLLRSALQKLIPQAEKRGVVLALEPMHVGCASEWTFLTNFEEAWELVRSFDSPWLKLTFDSYHLAHDESLIERLAEIVPYVALVQLGDARQAPHGEQNRCRLLDGVLPLHRVVNSFLEAGYDGYFDIELMGEEIETANYHDLLMHSRQIFQELVGSGQLP